MQAAAGEAAAEMGIERRDAEGERDPRSGGAFFEGLELCAQLLEPAGLI